VGSKSSIVTRRSSLNRKEEGLVELKRKQEERLTNSMYETSGSQSQIICRMQCMRATFFLSKIVSIRKKTKITIFTGSAKGNQSEPLTGDAAESRHVPEHGYFAQ